MIFTFDKTLGSRIEIVQTEKDIRKLLRLLEHRFPFIETTFIRKQRYKGYVIETVDERSTKEIFKFIRNEFGDEGWDEDFSDNDDLGLLYIPFIGHITPYDNRGRVMYDLNPSFFVERFLKGFLTVN